MNLLSGCKLTIAPRFHLPLEWSRRLLVGTGIEHANGFFPRGPWREPTDDELNQLVTGSDEAIELFKLPEHLRAEWWKLLEHAGGAGEGPLPGFDSFVAHIVEFLAFKSLPLSEGATCEAVVNAPGQHSVRCDSQTGHPSGMSCSLFPRTPWPLTEDMSVPRLWGGVNLGDEATSLVLINLPCSRMSAELRLVSNSTPATVGELTEQFLLAFPNYPPIKLMLESGEGFRLPHDGVVVDVSAEGKQEPDVLLLISEGGEPAS